MGPVEVALRMMFIINKNLYSETQIKIQKNCDKYLQVRFGSGVFGLKVWKIINYLAQKKIMKIIKL